MKSSERKEKKNFNIDFDEYQMSIRYKAIAQCFCMTLILVIINGFVGQYYVWAPSMIQALILITIPTIYFITVTTFKSSYLSNRDKNPKVLIILFLIIGCMNMVTVISGIISLGFEYYLKDGMLTDNFGPIILTIFFIYTAICVAIKYIKDKSIDKNMDKI